MRFRDCEIKSNSELVYPARDFCAGAEARTFCNLNVALKGHSSTDRDTATLDLPLVYTRDRARLSSSKLKHWRDRLREKRLQQEQN